MSRSFLKLRSCKVEIFCQVDNAPYFVNITNNEVGRNLLGVYSEDAQLGLKYPGNYKLWVDSAK